tara:strand:- start:59 stop:1114 length:1056 start_codon:yes stop_codon:yes gene_type:complete
MKALNIEDYNRTIDYVLEFSKKLPSNLVPENIIHNGHIKSPGVSDIDLIFVFKDNFVLSSQFLYLFKEAIQDLPNKEIYFHHLPHIYPLSSIKMLPYMTYNPVSELKILTGKISFESKNLNPYQNILNSFEQIHNRITTLINLIIEKKRSHKALLLTGHSIIHTINCLKLLGAEIEEKNFTNFNEIEKIRKRIVKGGAELEYNFENICKGLITEFVVLLNIVNKQIEKKILVHFSKERNIFQYDNNIYLIKLNEKISEPKYYLNNNNLFIEGFSWQTQCIYENYFLTNNDFKTIFLDKEFSNQINKRINFIKILTSFNFSNFNTAVGRNSFHPLVRNDRFYWSAKNLNLHK